MPKNANGQVLFFDYSRTMPCTDTHGSTAYVISVEKYTLFVTIYLITNHADL